MKPRVFVSYDTEHDQELFDALCGQSENSGFDVLGGSRRVPGGGDCGRRVRSRIEEADQVIVICGEHSEESTSMHAELRVVQETCTPYFLLWGRRGVMCTKPAGARPAEGMYSWTPQNLHDQLQANSRKVHSDAAARTLRKPAWKGRSAPRVDP